MSDLTNRIQQIFEKNGIVESVGGNSPFLLEDSENVWYICSGKVEVFSVEIKNGNPVGQRHHFFTAFPGQMLFGGDFQQIGTGLGLLAVGTHGTRLIRMKITFLRTLLTNSEFIPSIAACIDSWVKGVSYGVSRDINPRVDFLLEPGDKTGVEPNQKARSRKGVIWIGNSTGKVLFIGMEEVSFLDKNKIFPLTPETWIQAIDSIQFDVFDTVKAMKHNNIWDTLDTFYEVVLSCEFYNTRLISVDEFNHLQQKVDTEALTRENALRSLASILKDEDIYTVETNFEHPLLEACKIVGRELGISIKSPPKKDENESILTNPLTEIAKTSGFRVRRVLLKDDWWRVDNGPLLGYYEKDQQPVALIPRSPGHYVIYDPVNQTRTSVTNHVAKTLSPVGYLFYRPFPHRCLSIKDLLRFALFRQKKDIKTVIFMGLAMGGLGLLVPIATGILIDTIIPGADRGQLFYITLALLTAAIASAIFFIVRSIAMLRIEAKMDFSTQSAVWDRLLALPIPFFRQFSAGDLAVRANGINAIRRLLSSVTVNSILGGILGVFNFLLLFYYSWKLALVATGLTFLSVFATIFTGYLKLIYQRKLIEKQGKIAGLVLQFITGISKLRISGSEGKAFGVWAKEFTEQKKMAFKSRMFQNGLEVFNSAFPLLSSITIFLCVLYFMQEAIMSGQQPMTTGQFLAFNAAYTAFISSAILLSQGVISVLNVIPLFERISPILETLPEVGINRVYPGKLNGEIEVSHLSFRYESDGPLILDDISFHVNPGEFVAIVGASGSGKSTLLRLLLGFEEPESGSIYYDGQDLANLDIQALRQQFGVVLQNGKLLPGDIFTNIVGSSLLTIEDAWEAARMAGIENDIKQMPMGMHTVISEGGGGISGGQRQRLLIARAIVAKPGIIFFDEATSALDNRTQEIVTSSLDTLQATRIVIAHRLSTIINADRIIVLKEGRIVQQGTFQELMEHPGTFQELAKRQLA